MPRRLRRLPCLALPGCAVVGGLLHVVVAAGRLARLRGLAGLRAPLPAGMALLLAPCRSVHTLGMRWRLDLVWLGGDGFVVRVDEDVGAWRVRSCPSARAVLEVPAGGGRAVARQLRQ
jgi:uncharacterized protein